MKVETQFLEDHQAQIVAELEPETLISAKKRAAQQLAKRVRVPGFRPGKAPYNVIERTVGEDAILESAIELLVKENYAKILEEAKVEPYAAGSLEEIVSKEPPTFRFLIPLRPEVTLGDYRAIRRPYDLPVVTDDEIQRTIRNLQERQAIVEPVERPVQAGDQVTVKLSGHRKQVEEGQEAEIVAERSQTVDVAQEGDDATNEWPFPAFSGNLIGMSVGEEKTLSYVYPEDYDYESLRQAEAEFHVRVEEVKARSLPDLDDEFAQSFGDFATMDDLKTRLRENLEFQSRQEYDRSYTAALLDEILEQSTVKYPPDMLQNEISAMIDELSVTLERRGMDMETYLKARKMDEAAMREEVRPAAEGRLQRSLLVMEISRKEDIHVDPKAIQMQAYQTMNQITQNLSGKDLRKANSQEFVSNLVGNITADMYNQATLEHLCSIAKGETAPMDVTETTSLVDADQPEVSEPVDAQPSGSDTEASPAE